MKSSSFSDSSSKPYRRLLACLAPCAMLLALCSLLPQAQAGGSWLVDGQAVQTLEVQTTNDDPAALHTDGSRPMLGPLGYDPSFSPVTNGLLYATAPWTVQYDLFGFDQDHFSVVLAPGASSLNFMVGNLFITGDGNIKQFDHGSEISMEERLFSGGGWFMEMVEDDPTAILNRTYADSRYVRPGSVSSQLVFDNALSTPTTGLFRAYAPWEGMVDLFIVDEGSEAVHLSNGTAGFYPTSDLYIFGAVVGDNSGGGRIDFSENTLKNGDWMLESVGPYDECIITRGFADDRYVMQSTGITTNYTVQAGDVLQIQNGVITAINP